MKKFIPILLLVCITASLFVSCSNDVTTEDIAQQNTDITAKVVIGNAKALEAVGNEDSYAVDELYWFYLAEKTSGPFITGEKREIYYPALPYEVDEQTGEMTLTRGLEGADLGEFSKGGWKFQFKGFHDNPFVWNELEERWVPVEGMLEESELTTDDPNAAYYALENINLTGDLAMSVSLKECDGLPAAGFKIGDIIFDGTVLDNPGHSMLFVVEGNVIPNPLTPASSIIEPVYGQFDNVNIHFSMDTLKEMSVGTHNLLFVVTSQDAQHGSYVVGSEPLTLVVKKGVQQTIGGEIDSDDDTANITVEAHSFVVTKSLNLADAVSDRGIQNVSVEAAPNLDEFVTTDVAFDFAGVDDEAVLRLSQVTHVQAGIATQNAANSAGSQGSEYVISDEDHAGVAAVDFTLLDANGQEVELNAEDGVVVSVETYIVPGLGDNVIVTYNGSTEGITNVSYNSFTGLLKFKTNHFSTFLVEFEGTLLDNDGNAYTLGGFRDAVNSGDTFEGSSVRLMKDVDISDDAWTPIGDGYRSGASVVGSKFMGLFDGQGHTIKGLNDGLSYTPAHHTDNEYNYGFFGNAQDAVFTNVLFEDVDIKSGNTDYSADAVGALLGFSAGNLTIDRVGVKSGSINGQSAAGVVGRAYGFTDGAAILIENCANAADITGTKPDPNNQSYTARAAGIAAFVNGANFGGAENTQVVINRCANVGTLRANGNKPIISGIANYGYNRQTSSQNSGNTKDNYTITNCLNDGVMIATETRYWMAWIACSCSDSIKPGDVFDFSEENVIGSDAEAWAAGEDMSEEILYVSALQGDYTTEFNGTTGIYMIQP